MDGPFITPPTRVDLVRIWSKMSVDVFLEKKMMGQTWRTNKTTLWKRNMMSEHFRKLHLSTSCCEPRKMYVPREGSFPTPVNCVDVVRRMKTNSDIQWPASSEPLAFWACCFYCVFGFLFTNVVFSQESLNGEGGPNTDNFSFLFLGLFDEQCPRQKK